MSHAAQQTTVDALLNDPDFPALVQAYREHAIPEVRGGAPDLEFYRHFEGMPGVTVWEVRTDERLTGFAALLVREAPHSQATVASTESLFAIAGGAALRRALEDYAKSEGAAVLLIAAPYDSRASKALVASGMRPCTTLHARQL